MTAFKPDSSLPVNGSLSPIQIIKIVCDFYDTEEALVYNGTREAPVVKVRHVIAYIMRNVFDYSFPAIGGMLGGRDHTTIMHACEKIKESIGTDFKLTDEIYNLEGLFRVKPLS